MAFSMAGGGAPKAEMNVTPLIDVLLVLIVIFMLVDALQQDKGLKAEIPQSTADPSAPPPERTIVVQVFEAKPGEHAAVKINEETVTWDVLPDRLREIFIRRNERVAFVKGGRELDFQVVAEVVDIVHHSGAERVGLITKGVEL